MKRKSGCGPGLLGLGLLAAFVVGEHYLAIYIPWVTTHARRQAMMPDAGAERMATSEPSA